MIRLFTPVPDDIVNVVNSFSGMEPVPYRVLAVHEDAGGFTAIRAYPQPQLHSLSVEFIPFQNIVPPDKPRATAGVLYTRRGDRWPASFGLGTEKGQLAVNIGSDCHVIDFDPSEWVLA